MASQEFLWKPVSESDGRLVVLIPNKYNNQINQVYVVTPDGQRVQGRFAGNTSNGQRGHFRFDRPGESFPPGSYVEMSLDNGQAVTWGIGNPALRNPGGLGQVGETGAAPSAATGASAGASVGTAETGPGFAYPQSDFSGLDFAEVTPSFLPNLNVPTVDPIGRTGEVGAFNAGQFQQNLQIGSQNAQDLIQLEFQGLQAFNRAARDLQQEGIIDENAFNKLQVAAANEFNRTQIPQANVFNQQQIGQANVFNQQQRLDQLDTALPGARDTILQQIERGKTLAEGKFVSGAEDRAFETAARNAAAEGTVVRGFGDDSVFGRRASDLLSAQQRLQLSQVGAQNLDRFLTLGANLAFDQPIKQNPILDQPLQFQPQQARTAQDIPGAPARPASELAVQQQGALTQLNTIAPSQAITFDIGQNQFQSNLDQRTNEFNSRLDFESQKFNSETGLQVSLEQLYADLFNAQQQASAINQGIATDIAQDQFAVGQQSATYNAIGQGIGGIASILRGVLSGGGGGSEAVAGVGESVSGVEGALGLSSSGASATIGGSEVVGSAATASGEAGYLLADGSVVGETEVAASGAEFALPSMGSVATPLAIVGAAIASGRGIYETIQGLTDGTITETDVKQGIGSLTGGYLPTGVNEILGRPINRADMANAVLLANPVTAPIAIADMLGFDVGFGGGKPAAQQRRDVLRSFGEDLGMFMKPSQEQSESLGLNPNHHYVQLADGSHYDIGLDGGHKISNYGLNVDGKAERGSYDIDWSDPRASDVVGYLNPVAFLVYGEDAQYMMGHLWNAAISNNRSLSESKNNVRQFADSAGLDYQTGLQILRQYKNKGNLSQNDYLSFLNGWNELMLAEGVPREISV